MRRSRGESEVIMKEQPVIEDELAAKPLSRWGTVLGSLGCGIGLVGFLVGMYEQPTTKPAQVFKKHVEAEIEQSHFASAPTYSEIDSQLYGVNRDWKSDLSKLKQINPSVFDRVVRTPEMKNEALRDRLRTRAFDTAPPAIPHPVDQRTAESCLACHGNGMSIAGKIATKMSHPLLTNCTQCHVEQASSMLQVLVSSQKPQGEIAADSWPPRNDFEGVKRAGPGTRLLPGLPPTIPHTLHMRDDCMSCHGTIARPGIRTTHPWLQNCRQCHAADGDLERAVFTMTNIFHGTTEP